MQDLTPVKYQWGDPLLRVNIVLEKEFVAALDQWCREQTERLGLKRPIGRGRALTISALETLPHLRKLYEAEVAKAAKARAKGAFIPEF